MTMPETTPLSDTKRPPRKIMPLAQRIERDRKALLGAEQKLTKQIKEKVESTRSYLLQLSKEAERAGCAALASKCATAAQNLSAEKREGGGL